MTDIGVLDWADPGPDIADPDWSRFDQVDHDADPGRHDP